MLEKHWYANVKRDNQFLHKRGWERENTPTMLNRLISIAPMMDCTDRHCRYFLRLISPHALLYTEMITTGAIIYGDRKHLLAFHPEEHSSGVAIGW